MHVGRPRPRLAPPGEAQWVSLSPVAFEGNKLGSPNICLHHNFPLLQLQSAGYALSVHGKMPCSRLTGVNDVSALSDAQLGEYMKNHRRPDNSFELPIDDWDTLSKEERDRLAQRLQFVHVFIFSEISSAHAGLGRYNEHSPTTPRPILDRLTLISSTRFYVM